MTTRSLLPLLSLFIACLPACGDAAAGAPSAAQAPTHAQAGASNADAGGKSNPGGAGMRPNQPGSAGGTTSGSAGSSSMAGRASSYSPPSTVWNSAKSGAITDERLRSEYESWKAARVQTCSNGSSIVMADGKVVSEGI